MLRRAHRASSNRFPFSKSHTTDPTTGQIRWNGQQLTTEPNLAFVTQTKCLNKILFFVIRPKTAGASHDSVRTQQGPGLQNTTKIPREKKEGKLWRETEKKRAKFGAVRLTAVPPRLSTTTTTKSRTGRSSSWASKFQGSRFGVLGLGSGLNILEGHGSGGRGL